MNKLIIAYDIQNENAKSILNNTNSFSVEIPGKALSGEEIGELRAEIKSALLRLFKNSELSDLLPDISKPDKWDNADNAADKDCKPYLVVQENRSKISIQQL